VSRDYRDDVIEILADSEAALIDLVAELAVEHFRLREAFIHTLKLADDARLEAQQQYEELWAALWREREAALDREREAA
jgi:hypothetical protein